MIEIKYGGGNSLNIVNGKNVVVVNPKRELFGLKDLNVKDKIELITEDQYLLNEDSRLLINTAGEYEVGPFSIKGLSAKKYSDYEDKKNATVYSIDVDDINVAILGDIKPELSDDELEFLGIIDILIIPVGGGGYTMYAKEAAKIVRQIEPKIVIPTTYGNDLKYPVTLDEIKEFEKELGISVNFEKTLKIKNQKDFTENLTVNTLEISI